MLPDKQFLERFEALTLDPEYFNHVGHIRMTWLYLQSYSIEATADKVSSGIKRYACSLGATDKFHETLTRTFVRIIALRHTECPESNWTDFLSNNRDLVDDAKLIVAEYYSDRLINSLAAKKKFVEPDKKHFNEK